MRGINFGIRLIHCWIVLLVCENTIADAAVGLSVTTSSFISELMAISSLILKLEMLMLVFAPSVDFVSFVPE